MSGVFILEVIECSPSSLTSASLLGSRLDPAPDDLPFSSHALALAVDGLLGRALSGPVAVASTEAAPLHSAVQGKLGNGGAGGGFGGVVESPLETLFGDGVHSCEICRDDDENSRKRLQRESATQSKSSVLVRCSLSLSCSVASKLGENFDSDDDGPMPDLCS